MDLTTLQNVKDWLSITDTNSDKVIARLITASSGTFLTAINRGTFLTSSYTDTRDGTGTDSIILINYPITAVASVKVNNITVPPSPDGVKPGFVFDQYGVYLVGGSYPFPNSSASGLYYPGYFPMGRSNVIISYTAGYATTPPDVEQAVIDMVAYAFRSRDRVGIVSEHAGSGLTTTYITKDIPATAAKVISQYKRSTPIA